MSYYGKENANITVNNPEFEGVHTPSNLYDALSNIWCAYSCAPRMRHEWTKENMTLGQCSITAFLAQDIFGGEVYGVQTPNGNTHCFNVIGDIEFDLTSEQFGELKLSYDDRTIQSRETHFAKKEKYLRYKWLKKRLKEYCLNTSFPVTERIRALRNEMESAGVDVYLATSSDAHGSEYVCDTDKVTEFFSGCTSDNVVLVVTKDDAGLWTDGRYFLSAEEELKGSGIGLMRIGEQGVPTVQKYLDAILSEGMVLGYDGATVRSENGAMYRSVAAYKKATVKGDFNPVNNIWKTRPSRPAGKVWMPGDKILGESAVSKIGRVKEALRSRGAEGLVLTGLDDIMWLTNLRGNDIPCNPVAFAYFTLNGEEALLYLQKDALTEEAGEYLSCCNITVRDYDCFDEELKEMNFTGNVLVNPHRVSDKVMSIFMEKGIRPVMGMSPTEEFKAIKNETELAGLRECFLKDSAALCRFLFAVEKKRIEGQMTEVSLAQKLYDIRSQIPEFLDLSFETISAYGANAAVIHYMPKEEKDVAIGDKGFYLVDSGAQYTNGTTDVTRTIPVGELSETMRRDFTLVAIANLRLLTAKFKYGCTGANLDMYARAPLWEKGIDYNHGTGHGIGFLLNVHEGPQNIGFRIKRGNTGAETVFEPGMIVSDEPGIYRAGEYGIRTESIVECTEDETNGFGRFLRLRPLTYVPISLDALDVSLMDASDIDRLNAYHEEVYSKISPLLDGNEEKEWLRKATASVAH